MALPVAMLSTPLLVNYKIQQPKSLLVLLYTPHHISFAKTRPTLHTTIIVALMVLSALISQNPKSANPFNQNPVINLIHHRPTVKNSH